MSTAECHCIEARDVFREATAAPLHRRDAAMADAEVRYRVDPAAPVAQQAQQRAARDAAFEEIGETYERAMSGARGIFNATIAGCPEHGNGAE